MKREWLTTPKNKRGPVCAELLSGLWLNELKLWRIRNGKMLQKEASAILETPEDTYRSWESGRKTPSKYAMIVLRQAMKEYDRTHPQA